jgi:3',5'-cyclic AMP phosphodiesterase CpdA
VASASLLTLTFSPAIRLAVAVLCVTALTSAPVKAQDAIASVLVGAGDIASCDSRGDEETARLLDRIPGAVFTTGDNVYDRGTIQEFVRCFGPSWGRHKSRIRPAAGNHDYLTGGARGYFTYFGAAAGPPDKGYYSYDIADWHIVVLNSNCGAIGGCGPDSPQARWLTADLARNPRICSIAYWHHPRFSSGPHGNHEAVQAFWAILYSAGVELVLNGHDHLYERFLPMAPPSVKDEARGIQQFTVGTGGASHYRVKVVKPNSAFRLAGGFGVLRLTLWPDRYAWEFIVTDRAEVRDAGSRRCH